MLALGLVLQPALSTAGSDPEPNTTEDPGAVKDVVHPIESSADYFSTIARSGYILYHRHCENCHGAFIDGTENGPGLDKGEYLHSYKARRLFHEHVRAPIEPHKPFKKKKDGLTFNHIEMIAKYLREFNDWSERQAELEPD